MSKPTDIESLAGICGDFPFDLSQLRALLHRLDDLKARRLDKTDDGSIDPKMWQRVNLITTALGDFVWAVECIENDGDPDDFIPF